MRATLFLALACLATWVAPSPAAAQPALVKARLAAADEAFRVQDFDRVIKILGELTKEESIGTIQPPAEQLKALERLGASYWFTGANDAAQLTFGRLLKKSDTHTLDALVYPKELREFFEATKRRLKELGFIGQGGPTDPPPTTNGPTSVLVREVETDSTPTLAYLLPGGVGQFANDHDAKGAIVLSLQAVGLLMTVVSYLSVEGLKQDNGLVAPEDEASANSFDVLWIAGVSIASTAYVYSVVDGLIYREPGPRVERRLERLDPRELEGVPGPGGGVRLQPLVSPAAGGSLGLSLGGGF